jgi:acylphosphatase
MSDVIRQVSVTGRVQGVGYRAWIEHRARANAVEGWVRNRRDGSVEALFAGPADVVADLIAKCRRGPSLAQVDDLQDQPASPDALKLRRTGERFSVLPTI